MRELPKYKKATGEDNDESGGQEDDDEKKPLSDEFSEKTNQLLDYIEKTYLQGVIDDDPQGKNIIEKMRLDNTQKVDYIRQQKEVVPDPYFSRPRQWKLDLITSLAKALHHRTALWLGKGICNR